MADTRRPIQRDRRLSVRVPTRLSTLDAVRDAVTGSDHHRLSEETCANLSEGGAFLMTHQPIQEGCRLILEFDLPGGDTVEAEGRVVWSRTELATPGKAPSPNGASGIGVRFTKATPEAAERLERYLKANLPRRSRRKPAPLSARSL